MENNKNTYDFVAIGDIVTEPFIRLTDAEATCDLDRENCKLCVRFGDKVPYENAEICRAVGNSANAAVCASRLGLKSALISYIGDDEIGKGNLEQLEINKVSTEYIKTEAGKESNYHYVLWYDVERTILVKHTEFNYHFDQNMPAPKMIYLSSLASNSEGYHNEIMEYIKNHPETKLAFQPGTFQMKLGIEKLKGVYENAELFFCNVEEAERILNTKEHDRKVLMKKLSDLGPKQIVMTDGYEGAYAFDGTKYFFMPIYPHEPVERTGAGDAYASTISALIADGKTLAEALLYAPINAMSVTLKVGAQNGLLTKNEVEKLLENAPSDYKLKEI